MQMHDYIHPAVNISYNSNILIEFFVYIKYNNVRVRLKAVTDETDRGYNLFLYLFVG